MECFSGLWVRRISPPVYLSDLAPIECSAEPITQINQLIMQTTTSNTESLDLREIIKFKADKHRDYFEKMATGTYNTDRDESSNVQNMAPPSKLKQSNKTAFDPCNANARFQQEEEKIAGEAKNLQEQVKKSLTKRQRRTGVVNQHNNNDSTTIFRSVKALRENYLKMWEKTVSQFNADPDPEETSDKNKLAPNKELLQPPSGYCSSNTVSDDESGAKMGVQRCGSSDSAMGHSEDEEEEAPAPKNPILSPYSPRGSIDHENVPSRTLIEAKFVPYPVDRKLSDAGSDLGEFEPESRRQSCITDDDGGEPPKYRYWRTPSVVVSDYSDDLIGGLTLEDIEYIRNQQARNKELSSSPESSLHSSCSNLNWCGSTISSLESDFVFRKPFRKSSNCSTCSTLSGDEEGENLLTTVPNQKASGWRKLRNIVQWTPFFQTYKKQRYPWVQLAGHQGNFKAGPDQGTILKKLCAKEEKCFKVLMKDVLRPYVPEYKGLVASDDGECSYIQLQDLLGDFVSPCVMDCKIGVRTYLEEELAKAKEKPKLRKDMYDKMCQIDSNAPTDEEHKLKGVTKPRYMVWRETISSTATLGFRIEGIRKADGTSSKDFKTTKSKDQIVGSFADFVADFPHALPKYIQRLKAIKATLETSQFFSNHEVIGSSLLFVHDRYNANVWLIDFAKTIKLPEDVQITHHSKWKVGNHEDGYLIGVDNLITIFKNMLEQQPVTITPPLMLPEPPEIIRKET